MKLKWKGVGPLFFLFPAMAIYLLVIVGPSLYSLYLSFFEWNGVAPDKIFVGFGNYVDLFTEDSVFMKALVNNVLWTAGSLAAVMVFALSMAMVLDRRFRGRLFFRGAFYFPYVLSNIVVALMWTWLYHPSMGFANAFLEKIGIPPVEWLSDPDIALFSVFIASTWQSLGAPMILFLAGLQSIPEEPYEAARVEGANPLQSFFYVTLPLLRETFVIVFATTLVGAMKVYDIIYAMTGGGPAQSTQVLASWMYFQTFQFNNIGIGSAISWVLVVVVMIITIPYVLHMSRRSHV